MTNQKIAGLGQTRFLCQMLSPLTGRNFLIKRSFSQRQGSYLHSDCLHRCLAVPKPVNRNTIVTWNIAEMVMVVFEYPGLTNTLKLWGPMGPYGAPWDPMRALWSFMVLHGPPWGAMEPYGNPMGLYEALWGSMGTHRARGALVGPCGAPWGSMRPYGGLCHRLRSAAGS